MLFQQINSLSRRLACQLNIARPIGSRCSSQQQVKLSNNPCLEKTTTTSRHYCHRASPTNKSLLEGNFLTGFTNYCLAKNNYHKNILFETNVTAATLIGASRQFHAAGSKINYLDFRYRQKTNHLKLHLLIIRRVKMKKHRRTKFRKKFKCLLAKQRLKREISKEKAFRVELLTMIRRAELFDPKEYALQKIAEMHNKPRELTKEEKLEEIKELIRINRHQVTYIKPKHRKAEV